ncbi:MAG: glycosyltransferase [Verrucomicrobia bacterium]|nr:glycosyltransferase [Verrucomicrobiota bacterium]
MSSIVDRILIAGTTPNFLNSNWQLRTHAANGFRQAYPDSDIYDCAWDDAFHLIRQLKPTLVIWMGGVMLEEYDLRVFSDNAKSHGGKIAFWMHDDPYELDASLRVVDFADYIFTTDRASVIHYPPSVPTFHLPLAACPIAHFRPVTTKSSHDWFFCGAPFPCRVEFFQKIEALAPDLNGLLAGPGWDLSKFKTAADITISPGQISNYYSTSKCVIYLGRDLNLANQRFGVKASTPGPRLFEAAMAGALQIVYTPGIEVLEYFADPGEIMLVCEPDESVEWIRKIKKSPDLSTSIGSTMQKCALHNHTYSHRAKVMVTTIVS